MTAQPSALLRDLGWIWPLSAGVGSRLAVRRVHRISDRRARGDRLPSSSDLGNRLSFGWGGLAIGILGGAIFVPALRMPMPTERVIAAVTHTPQDKPTRA